MNNINKTEKVKKNTINKKLFIMNDEKTFVLISLVKQHPVLYDKNCRLNKDPNAKNNAWKEVAKGSRMKVQECRVRWKTLRDRFCRMRRRILQGEISGAAPTSSKNAEFMKQMDFLDNIIVHKPLKTPKKSSPKDKSNPLEDVPKVEDTAAPEPIAESSESNYISVEPMQLLSSLPLQQWPQIIEDTVQYIKISADATAYSQTQWNENEPIDPIAEVSVELGSVENEDNNHITSHTDNELTESSNSVEVEESNQVPMQIKDEVPEIADVDHLVLGTLWNIIKNKALQNKRNYTEDQLFALSLIENLAKFPPKKKNMIKGEILLLMSKFDYKEIE